ncbi:LPS-assembly protein LptD [Notoacmeibacter ruber]|uniref:LPS-assembly protein LptD n=1 Tax=Notoacmeibacter ruber TaxID=2670375 RepID=A0A3L7JDI0_9HYPH|nr:LPS-assembly protein LptD [Notoacmeibacter ruber]RLQ87641.1 LPS-assembly protein LptD [Notoacmeibacter ruber]
MRGWRSKTLSTVRGLTALLLTSALTMPVHTASAAPAAPPPASDVNLASALGAPDPERMLIEAQTLEYDIDGGTVTVYGAVRIYYQGNSLVADRVTYDQKGRKLQAVGNVELVQPGGTIINAAVLDITDDFANGFVNALRVTTPNRTFFGAQSAVRQPGDVTIFNSAVYTACEPCEENPDKSPIWRIKSRRVIWDGEAKTVTFDDPTFEFLGVPLFRVGGFTIDDPTVKRKSGFLFPTFGRSSNLGYYFGTPYYFALSPSSEAIFRPVVYSKQGLLLSGFYARRFANGYASISAAGIYQLDPDGFGETNVSNGKTLRGMVGTRGQFTINKNFIFGWNVLAESDKNFAKLYDIENYTQSERVSEVWLQGSNDRNWLDLRAGRFQVQESVTDDEISARHRSQPWFLPSADYRRVDEDIAGGELRTRVNTRTIYRQRLRTYDNQAGTELIGVPGPEGLSSRLTAESTWRRQLITDNGLVVTPLLSGRVDVIETDFYDETDAALATLAANQGTSYDERELAARGMATAAVQVSYPFLFSAAGSSHVIEPIGQIIARPDAPYQETFGLPNEDAQALTFTAANLFDIDKFSGMDRMEGGTRANVGLRYVGTFDNGWRANALVGQSYHLAGENPFADPDIVKTGMFSGLEDDVSDVVAQFGINTPGGLQASFDTRISKDDGNPDRLAARLSYVSDKWSLGVGYSSVEGQPGYGLYERNEEGSVAGSLKFAEHWTAFAKAAYNFDQEYISTTTTGLAYEDSCYTFAGGYSMSRNDSSEISHDFKVFMSFRTLVDIGEDARPSFDQ